mmetsp:Transcript_7762/g.14087  ORF Transcript_7762/g.14087 Transcript_7762/m.14087 type:complete len:274 (-) Transcript_7762:689-1510(-)
MATNDSIDGAVEKFEDGTGVRMNGWEVRAYTGHITTISETETLESQLNIQLPAMIFPHNKLMCFQINNSNVRLEFNAENALKCVSKSPDPELHVRASELWKRKNQERHRDLELSTLRRASDWTFTSKYTGDVIGLEREENPKLQVDIEQCKRTDIPIVYYREVVLYEDELDDHGMVACGVRVRVMPTFFLILLRFFLRIDGVMLRFYDTRFYHDFKSNIIVQHIVHRQTNETEYRRLESTKPRSLLSDPDNIVNLVPIIHEELINWKSPEQQE